MTVLLVYLLQLHAMVAANMIDAHLLDSQNTSLHGTCQT